MEEVADRHLMKRNGVWYYRRRVPSYLKTAFEKPFIQQSLETRSVVEARRQRNILDVRYDLEFATLSQSQRTGPGQPEEAGPIRLTSEELSLRLAAYIEEQVAKFEKRWINYPPTSSSELEDMQREKEIELQALLQPNHPDQHLAVHRTYERLVGERELADLTEAEAAEFVRRGLLAIARQQLRIERDEFGETTRQLPRSMSQNEPTFGFVAAQYLEQEREKAHLNKRRSQWVEKLEAHVEVLKDIVGENTTVRSVDYDKAKRVQSVLSQLPAHREKHYPGLPIETSISRGLQEGRPHLSATTQHSYLNVFRSVLDLATAKRLIPNNPASEMRPLVVDARSASERRVPFSTDQIVRFFSSAFYQRWRPGSTNPYMKSDRDWRFWLPLLMALTGMRPAEICQMTVSDIRRHPAGFWYAHVTPTDDSDAAAVKKRLKTRTSKRSFPVHPGLIAVGFLDFVDQRRKAGEAALLFGELKPSRRGYYSDYPCRRFREVFLGEALELETGQSLYSFRHSFRDALRRVHAPDDILEALGGWSQGARVSDSYGDPKSPEYLNSYVSGIVYPGLKLDFHY